MVAEAVRVGVIGVGRLGALHATNLAGSVPSAELAWVVDTDVEAARKVSDALGGVEWSTRYADLLDGSGVDAVVIATSTSTHVGLIQAAARAGKHVFCEKPIALDLESTHRAMEAVRAAGTKMQVGFHRRFDPEHRAARRGVAAGDVGQVHFLRATYRDARPPTPEYSLASGGLFTDITLHDFDQARWLSGEEVEEVTAKGSVMSDVGLQAVGDLDNGVVVLRFRSGALGVIDTSTTAGYGCECSVEVMGSKATFRIGDDGVHRRPAPQTLKPGTLRQTYVQDYTERFPRAFVAEMEAFVNAVTTDEEPEVRGSDAAAAFVIAQAAWLSYREGRTVRLESKVEPDGVVYRVAG